MNTRIAEDPPPCVPPSSPRSTYRPTLPAAGEHIASILPRALRPADAAAFLVNRAMVDAWLDHKDAVELGRTAFQYPYKRGGVLHRCGLSLEAKDRDEFIFTGRSWAEVYRDAAELIARNPDLQQEPDEG